MKLTRTLDGNGDGDINIMDTKQMVEKSEFRDMSSIYTLVVNMGRVCVYK